MPREYKGMEFTHSVDDPTVGYLRLPNHPGPGLHGIVTRSVRLRDLLSYIGPDVMLDIDAEGRLIGVEIIG